MTWTSTITSRNCQWSQTYWTKSTYRHYRTHCWECEFFFYRHFYRHLHSLTFDLLMEAKPREPWKLLGLVSNVSLRWFGLSLGPLMHFVLMQIRGLNPADGGNEVIGRAAARGAHPHYTPWCDNLLYDNGKHTVLHFTVGLLYLTVRLPTLDVRTDMNSGRGSDESNEGEDTRGTRWVHWWLEIN